MQYSENYGLKKPESTDYALIADLNYNTDKIDALIVGNVGKIHPEKINGVTIAENMIPYASVNTLSGKYVSATVGNAPTFSTNSNYTTYKLKLEADTVYYFSKTKYITLVNSEGNALVASPSSGYQTKIDTSDYSTAVYVYYSTSSTITATADTFFGKTNFGTNQKAEISWLGIPDTIKTELDEIAPEGANLFNPDKKVENYFISEAGYISASSSYDYLATYIPVTAGDKIYCNTTMRFVTAYDADGNADSTKGSSSVISAGTAFTVLSGTAFIRITIYKTTKPVMLCKNYAKEYEPYGIRQIPKLESILGGTTCKVEKSSISSGSMVEIENFPRSIKKNIGMSFYGKFSTFTGLKIGKGQTSYEGQYLEITATQIIPHSYYSGDTAGTAVDHGLTLSTFIAVNWYVDDTMTCYVKLTTLGGSFDTTFTWNGSQYGIPFVYADTAMTETVTTISSADIRCPMWIFGDSYFGLQYPKRILYQIKDLGFINFLASGRSGQSPAEAYEDVKRLLSYGTPKFIVWMEGMNGTETDAITVMNNLKAICEEKNITLIVTKIPTVPERSKETLNTAIENSHLRYIDSYKAVGADSTGTWYTGYQGEDEVHPTTLGARAIAMRMLVDVPEIMVYGRS